MWRAWGRRRWRGPAGSTRRPPRLARELAQADLDLGNYERFLDLSLSRDNNLTTGKVYQAVIERERRGDYLGKTVQVVPHITDAIQDWLERVAHTPVDGRDGCPAVCVIELGGTVGDIESSPFIEALRQFQFRVGAGNFCVVHVSLVPVIGVVGEQKTKPTQHSVATLRSLGLNPALLACRSSEPLAESTREKLVSERGGHVSDAFYLGVRGGGERGVRRAPALSTAHRLAVLAGLLLPRGRQPGAQPA